MLTQKDYVRLAEILRNAVEAANTAGEVELVTDTVKEIVNWLEGDNPRFDRGRFLAAVSKARAA